MFRRSLRAAQFLKQVGFEQVVSVTGGTQAWRQAGKALALDNIRFDGTRIVETEWTHAGASTAMLEPASLQGDPGAR